MHFIDQTSLEMSYPQPQRWQNTSQSIGLPYITLWVITLVTMSDCDTDCSVYIPKYENVLKQQIYVVEHFLHFRLL